MTTRNNDEMVVFYLVNRKIATNLKLVKLYGDKADFPKEKLLSQNNKMKQIRGSFLGESITFDEAVKTIVNDSIDDDFYQKYK